MRIKLKIIKSFPYFLEINNPNCYFINSLKLLEKMSKKLEIKVTLCIPL